MIFNFSKVYFAVYYSVTTEGQVNILKYNTHQKLFFFSPILS